MTTTQPIDDDTPTVPAITTANRPRRMRMKAATLTVTSLLGGGVRYLVHQEGSGAMSSKLRFIPDRAQHLAAAALLIIAAAGGMLGATTHAANAQSAVIHVTTDVNLRGDATTNSARTGGLANGTAVNNIDCAKSGQNINGVSIWMHTPNGFFSSYYDDSHYSSFADLQSRYGIRQCGSAPAPAPTASGDAPLVWVGSPIDGTWDLPAKRGGDGAAAHHWLGNASDKGDFAIDLVTSTGQQAILYAAPQDGRTAITARVDQIGAACGGGANGAQFVTVGLYAGSTRVGSATYAHINPTVRVGQTLSRWGSLIGTVAGNLPYNRACWTGPHVHAQVYSNHHYACFNRGYALGQAIHRTNFIAFTGGNVASGARQACR